MHVGQIYMYIFFNFTLDFAGIHHSTCVFCVSDKICPVVVCVGNPLHGERQHANKQRRGFDFILKVSYML